MSGCMDTIRSRRSRRNSLTNKMLYNSHKSGIWREPLQTGRVPPSSLLLHSFTSTTDLPSLLYPLPSGKGHFFPRPNGIGLEQNLGRGYKQLPRNVRHTCISSGLPWLSCSRPSHWGYVSDGSGWGMGMMFELEWFWQRWHLAVFVFSPHSIFFSPSSMDTILWARSPLLPPGPAPVHCKVFSNS